MKRKHHKPVAAGFSEGIQITCKLRTAKQLLDHGQTVADVCRSLELLATIDHRWQPLYGWMKATEAKLMSEQHRIEDNFYRLH